MAPAELLERNTNYLPTGHNQYAPMAETPQLREAIAHKIAANCRRQVNPKSQITITSGATSALFFAVEALVHTGDEVIIFDPAYDSYEPAIRLAGGHAVGLSLQAPKCTIDWE